MKELLIENLKTLKNYTGLRPLFALTAVSWLFLLLKEKDQVKRSFLVYLPATAGFIFLCPLTLRIYEAAGLDVSTYYRMLWVIPFGILTVYAMVVLSGLFRTHGRLLAALCCAVLIGLCGTFIYTSPVLYRSENIYGLPQTTIDIVDYLRSIDDHKRITVLPSSTTVTSIRQYDANILMPYGRDMFNPTLNYYHPVYEAFEKDPVIQMDKLLEASREYDVEYIILYAAKLTDVDPEEAGLIYLTTIDDHKIYRDPVISEKIKEIDKYYGNDV